MNLQKFNPWNWFKHEENDAPKGGIQIKRDSSQRDLAQEPSRNDHPIALLQRDFDRLFDDLFSAFDVLAGRDRTFGRDGWLTPRLTNWPVTQDYRPNIDVTADERNYQIDLDVPGLKESDLSLEVRGDVLTIRGQKQESHEEENKDRQYYRVERRYGAFQRVLSLPDDANASDIQATLKDGVLKLLIPRVERKDSDVKRIPIN